MRFILGTLILFCASLLTAQISAPIPGQHLYLGALQIPVTNLRVISNVNRTALPSGDTDIYTVPTGKKALVFDASYTNPTGGATSPVCFAEYKSSGVYTIYDFISNGATPGTLGTVALLIPMLLNAGESWSTHCDLAGLSLWPFILEFDASAPVQVARLNSFSVGDNTVLTVPANGIQIYPNAQNIGAGSVMKGSLFYFNNTGIARTVGWNLIPSGGSAANSNQIATGLSVSSPAASVKNYYGGLAAGDKISINVDANTAGQSAVIIYQTLP